MLKICCLIVEIIIESNEMDSDPMRFFVMLLLYETRICSEPARISNTSTTDLAQYHLEQKLIAGCHYCWSTGLTEREIHMQYYRSLEMYTN